MPRHAIKKSGLAEALSGEISRAVSDALDNRKLPSANDIRNLVKALKALNKTIGKVPASEVPAKAKAGPGQKRGPKRKPKKCSVRGCKRPHYAKGLCDSHYNMQLRKKKLEAEKGTTELIKKRGKKPGRKQGRKPSPVFDKPWKKRGRAVKVAGKTCTIEGCGNPHYAKGLCTKHYQARLYHERKAKQKG